MTPKPRAVDRIIARIAGRQHGIVTAAQLVAAGIDRDAIRLRVERGTLIRVHQGVFRVGHAAPSMEADYCAAVLACGKGSYLGGRAAGSNYRILKGPPAPPEVVALSEKNRPGIITRRAKLDRRDVTVYRRIPSLTVPALMVDLAPQMTVDELGEVAQKADAFFGVSVDAVAAVARRRGPFTGIAKLREVYIGDAPILLSELERRFFAFIVEHGFPLPRTNRREEEGFVDCRWPDHRLTAELDSYRFHRGRRA
jgi:hypothetical protein